MDYRQKKNGSEDLANDYFLCSEKMLLKAAAVSRAMNTSEYSDHLPGHQQQQQASVGGGGVQHQVGMSMSSSYTAMLSVSHLISSDSLGRLFYSSPRIQVSEAEEEYRVTLMKHIFRRYILAEFNITNTIPDQQLKNVTVRLIGSKQRFFKMILQFSFCWSGRFSKFIYFFIFFTFFFTYRSIQAY
jgi:hypothetical protein